MKRWTIKICKTTGQPGHCVCPDPKSYCDKYVEVVPAADLDRLAEALRKIRAALAPLEERPGA